MTISPSLEIQGLIVATLKADAAVSSLVNGVFDVPPQDANTGLPTDAAWGAKLAYISLGPTDINTDDADCILGEEHNVQIDVWSRTVGSVGCKKICDAVKRALHERDDLALADNALVEIQLTQYQIMRDPDGETAHGAMQFTVTIEES